MIEPSLTIVTATTTTATTTTAVLSARAMPTTTDSAVPATAKTIEA